jgi:hypothetical protein
LDRFIEKIRLRHAGKIQDYNYITVGFDKYLVDSRRGPPASRLRGTQFGILDHERRTSARAFPSYLAFHVSRFTFHKIRAFRRGKDYALMAVR